MFDDLVYNLCDVLINTLDSTKKMGTDFPLAFLTCGTSFLIWFFLLKASGSLSRLIKVEPPPVDGTS